VHFDHSSFSRSRDVVGANQNLNGLRDLTTPLSGMTSLTCQVAILGLGLATTNLPTEFEASISTRSEDMKRKTKCEKRGSFM